MSVRIDASGDYVSRSANLPAGNLFSVCFWCYLTTDRNATGTLFLISNAAGTQYNQLILGSDGTTLTILDQNGNAGSTSLSTGTWYHLAYTRNGATQKSYINGVLDTTRSNNNTLTTPSMIAMGSNTSAWLNGRLSNIKLWNAELTADEINAERLQFQLRRFTNINLWCPMFSGATERLADYSGNARNLTSNGTLSDEDQPPIPWGSAPLIVRPPSNASQNAAMNAAAVTLAALSTTPVLGDTNVPMNKANVTIAANTLTTSLSITAAINLATVSLSALAVTTYFIQPMNFAAITLAANSITPVLGDTNVPMNNAAVTLAAYNLDATRIQAINTANVNLTANSLSADRIQPMNAAAVTLSAFGVVANRIQPINAASVTLSAFALDAARIQSVNVASVTLAGLGVTPVLGNTNAPMTAAAVTLAAYNISTSLSLTTPINTTNITLAALQPAAIAVVLANLNMASVMLAAFNVATSLSITAAVNLATVSIAAYGVSTALSLSTTLNTTNVNLAAYSVAASAVTLCAMNTANVAVAALGVSTSLFISVALNLATVSLAALQPTALPGSITAVINTTNVALAAYNLTATISDTTAQVGTAAVTLSALNPIAVVGSITALVNSGNVNLVAYGLSTLLSIVSGLNYAAVTLQAFNLSTERIQPVGFANVDLAGFPVYYQLGSILGIVGTANVVIQAYDMTYATDTASVGYAQIVLQAFDAGLPASPVERTFLVPVETRVLIVPEENRAFIVPVDDRVFIVDE